MHQTFGNIPVVNLFGDVLQLGAVKQTDLHHPPTDDNAIKNAGYTIYSTIKNVIVLDEIMRQKPAQQALRSRLNNIRCGKITQEDCLQIRNRLISKLSVDEQANFKGDKAIWLCERWEDVNLRNYSILKTFSAVAQIRSEGRGRHHHKEDRMGQIPIKCTVATGCRVMLTKNQGPLTSLGLNNGAVGTVRSILYQEGMGPNSFPEVIFVDFPGYTGPAFHPDHPKCVPIPPVETRCESDCCTRKGFPLMAAYAITISKSQGMTIGPGQQCTHAVINLRISHDMESRAPGLTYTAFSRVSEDTDWCLAQDIPNERLMYINQHPQMKYRLKEEDRLNKLSETTFDNKRCTSNEYKLLIQQIDAYCDDEITDAICTKDNCTCIYHTNK